MTPLALASDARVSVTLRGVEVLVDVAVDCVEVRRRMRTGIAGRRLAGIAALRMLLELPEDAVVGIDTVNPSGRAVLDRVVGGLEYPGPGLVRRVARPAARARLVSIPVNRWREGMRVAGRFAPYCARSLLLDRLPADLETLCLEASYWGVGVAVREVGETEREIVPPTSLMPACYTAAAWSFDEDLYAQL